MAAPQASLTMAQRSLVSARRPVTSSRGGRLSPVPPRRAAARPMRRATVCAHAAQKQIFSSFQDLLNGSDVPVLVDFYATWCGPCQLMASVFDSVAPEMRGRVKFVKLDTERYPSIANQFKIGALPTLILFKKGKPVDRVEGALLGDQLKQRLEYFLSQ